MLSRVPSSITGVDDETAAAVEEATLKWLQEARDWGKRAKDTEVPLQVVVTGPFGVSDVYYEVISRNNAVKKPAQYSIPIFALFYRNPETGYLFSCCYDLIELGWDKEQLVAFDLSSMGPYGKPPQAKIPPCTGVAVGHNWHIEVSTMPESWLAKYLPKRCPKEMQEPEFGPEREQAE